MAATKSSKDARQGLSWHEKRCEVREKSTKGKYLRSSLQCLDDNEILLLLESILPRSKQGTQTNCTVRGLRAVQEHLMHGYGSASYPDVSLFMKMCAQRKAGRRQRARRLADLGCLPFDRKFEKFRMGGKW